VGAVIIDNFLDNYDDLKKFSLSCQFKDEVNPVDGVVYPAICLDVPPDIVDSLFRSITNVIGRPPENPLVFLRMSKAGVAQPPPFHTDNSMGAYSLMLYLMDRPDAGTGFVKHKETGVYAAPFDENQLNLTIRDCNDDSKWQLYEKVEMRQNRAVIFNSSLFHVALPIGGFGKSQSKARIVLTCFFS
jgi:hypothetical protein